jgi:hypothetical protein
MAITIEKSDAVAVATLLFPNEVADDSDCRKEVGREGQPCMICAEKNEQWQRRIGETMDALRSVFEPR